MFGKEQQLSQELVNMQRSLQHNQPEQVVKKFKQLSSQFPNQPDLYHLAALAYKQLGQLNESRRCFEKSLEINSKQPFVHNNLANMLLAQKLFLEAEFHYEKALSLKPDYPDAWKNLAIAYLSQRKFEKAHKAIDKAIGFAPNQVSLVTIKANIFKDQEDFEQAIAYYQQALQLDANYVNALHNLGLTYKLLEQHDYALACLNKAQQLAPNISEIDYSLANTYFELGQHQQAEQSYWKAINKKPNNVDVHKTLNEFYWQRGDKLNFGKSFKQTIEHIPNDLTLRHAFADSLFSANQYDAAEAVVKEALKQGNEQRLLHILGKINAVQNNNQHAMSLFEQALSQEFNLALALDLINIAIVEADYEKALHFIAQAELREPLNQLLLAYKGICWRLLNDERHFWLNDYERFVKGYELAVPNGYANLEAFLEELEVVLLSMHGFNQEPLNQTLKNGTQTPGRLLHKKHPVIAKLKQGLSEIVNTHISSLPDDPSHPLLSRKSNKFTFAGSWSVKLKPNGFHVNHVHPAGWLSSSFYVSMPDLSESQLQDGAGAIKFGETSMNLGQREQIAKVIQPIAGTLALFPSYTWHGTIPFDGDEGVYRMTSPFDVVPI